MAQHDPDPEPGNSLTPTIDLLKTVAEAFTKLPPLLAYGGLVLIVAVVILAIGGVLPNVLLWLPAAAIAAFLIYAYMQFAEEKAKRQFELDKQAQELRHQQEMARLARQAVTPAEETPRPPLTPPTPETGTPTPASLERSYLRHLVHLCGYPPSMALVDIKEAGLAAKSWPWSASSLRWTCPPPTAVPTPPTPPLTSTASTQSKANACSANPPWQPSAATQTAA